MPFPWPRKKNNKQDIEGACTQVKEIIKEVLLNVYGRNAVELDEDSAGMITEMAISMMYTAAKWGYGDTALRARAVYTMLMAYRGGENLFIEELELAR
jgi:hypothetical protein